MYHLNVSSGTFQTVQIERKIAMCITFIIHHMFLQFYSFTTNNTPPVTELLPFYLMVRKTVINKQKVCHIQLWTQSQDWLTGRYSRQANSTGVLLPVQYRPLKWFNLIRLLHGNITINKESKSQNVLLQMLYTLHKGNNCIQNHNYGCYLLISQVFNAIFEVLFVLIEYFSICL